MEELRYHCGQGWIRNCVCLKESAPLLAQRSIHCPIPLTTGLLIRDQRSLIIVFIDYLQQYSPNRRVFTTTRRPSTVQNHDEDA